jgi:hypothetical protein
LDSDASPLDQSAKVAQYIDLNSFKRALVRLTIISNEAMKQSKDEDLFEESSKPQVTKVNAPAKVKLSSEERALIEKETTAKMRLEYAEETGVQEDIIAEDDFNEWFEENETAFTERVNKLVEERESKMAAGA